MKPFTSACLAFASVCAAGAVAGAARPQYGGTLRVETDAIVRTIDPAAAASDIADLTARGRVSSLVFEPLVAIDGEGLHPRLATAWEREGRSGRWRFHLKNGVALHDGTTLEAWQAAASLRASEPAWKVAAEGDTIAIDPDVPAPDLPWLLADDRHAIVVRGSGAALIGSGPFRLDRIDGARVSLRAHDGYWRARPFVDAVQIDGGRKFDAMLTDLEAARADLVGVRPIDARRAARRGVRLESTNPLELVALVFESHRGSDASLPWRRTIAAAPNRDAICAVVLQGHAVPARSILPAWLSGYAPVVELPEGSTLTRAAVAALPPDLRDLTIRVDAADAVVQAIAERIVADAREAGFGVKLQTPAGLAPRPDARLVRVALAAAGPDRAFAQAAARLAVRGWPSIAAPDGPALDATYRAEQALIDRVVVVPIAHVPELYALGERVGFSARPAANPTGGWNLADIWVRGKP
jgi:peptide/nickel transport system substrate-binding protein